ncbi:hypothetical protein [Pseudorhodoplanes sinuspersici]|uniref:Uncharacterized protein n=1 Tax=Pseudorhodoplanes sinuspersici TaxID=1235591 RepID=A0A1W6ZMD5_9HYPH|nr:hypothetical protein [Pseudorhodoplanes sinuspersici]ARP97934.1 hypothetical protein CAK95_01710 [Pseudorhodoplanes sinuspersici]RKE68323.1 hypothetical protein DFP91_4699 [Pseudorhodoplanes sinuspersici]
MTAMTVGSTATLPASAAAPKTSLFARAWAAFVAGRMRQAEREIAMHQHLLPTQFEYAGDRLARSEKDLPFAR